MDIENKLTWVQAFAQDVTIVLLLFHLLLLPSCSFCNLLHSGEQTSYMFSLCMGCQIGIEKLWKTSQQSALLVFSSPMSLSLRSTMLMPLAMLPSIADPSVTGCQIAFRRGPL
jgi:hypothetical protein